MHRYLLAIAVCLAMLHCGYVDDATLKELTVSCNGGVVHFQQFRMTQQPKQKPSTYG